MNVQNANTEPETDNARLDKALVHKWNPENVLIGPVATGKDRLLYFSNLVVDTNHPFFFEHPQDHVPGMMTVEAARQILTAIAHLYGNIPVKGYKMILNYMDVRFNNYLELDSPAVIHAKLTEVVADENELWTSFTGRIHVTQGANEAALMQVEASVMSERSYQRLRRWSKKKLMDQSVNDVQSRDG